MMTSEEKEKALNPAGSFFNELARAKWTACEFQEIYFSLCDEQSADPETWLKSTCCEVLDFGGCMAKFNVTPSLISMTVPFGVRRQCYELRDQIEAMVYTALNSNDFYYNVWAESQKRRNRAVISKAQLAKALWKWYYTVFEPVATRFSQVGSEHHSFNNLK